MRLRNIPVLLVCLGFLLLSSCAEKAEVIVKAEYDSTAYFLQTGLLAPPDIAADNQLTVQGVKLGRMLFYETRLSKDGTQSCAGCHRQEHAFTDTAQFSTGVEGLLGKRQAMAVFNMAWNSNEFFWDGRSHLLRDQSLKPIQDPLEMNETLENVIAKLSADSMYTNQFMRAFGSEIITEEKMSLAMEQFMNSIVSVDSKYDRYLAGSETLSASEERGRELFFLEYNPGFPESSGADCAHCHSGKNFENDKYINNGLDLPEDITDIGREEVTGMDSDKAKFKVTSLRNIELTQPYMHDGRFTTLEQVIDHYNENIKKSPSLDPALEYTTYTGLMLTEQDKIDLVAFLKTLTDDVLPTNPEYSDPF
jgi:cytochrome c peroxidase